MRAGDQVELRPPREILATLDQNGCLEGVPFMPEMLGFFGRTFTVTAQVERACDTICYSGPRRIPSTVMLDDLRCDGAEHAGCQARCRIYWKEQWLRPAGFGSTGQAHDIGDDFAQLKRIAEAKVHAADSTADEPTFRCQATELRRASELVRWWSVRSFLHEVSGGNVPPARFVRVMTRVVLEEIGRRLRLISRSPLPFAQGRLTGENYVALPLRGLQPGDLVQVRSKAEIAATLNKDGKHKGLWFDKEMLPYCGKTVRVKAKVAQFLDEGSGRVITLASDAYILENVVCRSYHSDGRWFCPRAIYPWWREAWLRPVEKEAAEHLAEAPAPTGAAAQAE